MCWIEHMIEQLIQRQLSILISKSFSKPFELDLRHAHSQWSHTRTTQRLLSAWCRQVWKALCQLRSQTYPLWIPRVVENLWASLSNFISNHFAFSSERSSQWRVPFPSFLLLYQLKVQCTMMQFASMTASPMCRWSTWFAVTAAKRTPPSAAHQARGGYCAFRRASWAVHGKRIGRHAGHTAIAGWAGRMFGLT